MYVCVCVWGGLNQIIKAGGAKSDAKNNRCLNQLQKVGAKSGAKTRGYIRCEIWGFQKWE